MSTVYMADRYAVTSSMMHQVKYPRADPLSPNPAHRRSHGNRRSTQLSSLSLGSAMTRGHLMHSLSMLQESGGLCISSTELVVLVLLLVASMVKEGCVARESYLSTELVALGHASAFGNSCTPFPEPTVEVPYRLSKSVTRGSSMCCYADEAADGMAPELEQPLPPLRATASSDSTAALSSGSESENDPTGFIPSVESFTRIDDHRAAAPTSAIRIRKSLAHGHWRMGHPLLNINILDQVFTFFSWKEVLHMRGVSRRWFMSTLSTIVVCRLRHTGKVALFLPCRQFCVTSGTSSCLSAPGVARVDSGSASYVEWSPGDLSCLTGSGSFAGSSAAGMVAAGVTPPRRFKAKSHHRLFLGQLRRDSTVPLMHWMAHTLLEGPNVQEGTAEAAAVAESRGTPLPMVLGVDNHVNTEANRGKGCGWIYLSRSCDAERLLTYHKRAFYDIWTESDLPGAGALEGLWILRPQERDATPLTEEANVFGYLPQRPRWMPRNLLVVEVPSAAAARPPHNAHRQSPRLPAAVPATTLQPRCRRSQRKCHESMDWGEGVEEGGFYPTAMGSYHTYPPGPPPPAPYYHPHHGSVPPAYDHPYATPHPTGPDHGPMSSSVNSPYPVPLAHNAPVYRPVAELMPTRGQNPGGSEASVVLQKPRNFHHNPYCRNPFPA